MVSANVSSWFPRPLLRTITLLFHRIMELLAMPLGIKDLLDHILRLTMDNKTSERRQRLKRRTMKSPGKLD